MPEYRFAKAPDVRLQGNVNLYRFARPAVSSRAVLREARRFGLSGQLKCGRSCQDARQLAYQEGTLEVVVHRASGGIRYHDLARWQVDDGSADVTIDDDRAIDIATRVVGDLDLAPADEYEVLRVTRLNVGLAERATGFSETRIIDVGVAFRRLVDGIPVEGPGGKLLVYLDQHGEVTGVDRLWREVKDVFVPSVELRSPESAQEDVRARWGDGGIGIVEVDAVRLAYFEAGWNDAQRFLQPAYVMPLTLRDTEEPRAGHAVMRSEHVVAAAVDPPERLFPRRPHTRAQALRQFG